MLFIHEELKADPIQAISYLKEQIYDHDRFTIDEYIIHLGQSLWKFHSLGLDIRGGSLEEKCQNVLNQLLEYGLIKIH